MAEFYVSTLGSDAASGRTPNSPFATIEAAIRAMAANAAADTAYILGGTHYLNGRGLTLTGANSNDRITAYPGTNPVISGGSAIPASSWSVDSNGIWSTRLATTDVGQLVVNGQRQTLARYPSKVADEPIQGGWLWAQPLPSGGNPLKQMAYRPADFFAGHEPVTGQTVTLFDAKSRESYVLKIAAVDTATCVITFDKPATHYIGPGSRYFIAGSHFLLDQPGEWYFDQATGILHFKALAGFDGAGAVVSGTLSIINVFDAENISIQGLKFSDAATNARNGTLITTAAIYVDSSSGIEITGNYFTHVAQGVRIRGRSDGNTVSNNAFSNVWGHAVAVGRGAAQNRIVQNSILSIGELFAAACAIQLENTWGNIVSDNHIENVPRFGISDIRYDHTVQSGANVIEHNTILHSGRATNDTAAIYVASSDISTAFGDTIRSNIIDDTGGLATNADGFVVEHQEGAGIYIDSNMSGALISDNVIRGSTIGIFLQGSGNNDIHNNAIYEDQSLSELNRGRGTSAAAISSAAMSGDTIQNDGIDLAFSGDFSAASTAYGLTADKAIAGIDVTLNDGSAETFTGSATSAVTIATGATVEIDGASAHSVTFAGETGTLEINDAAAFTGQVSGLSGSDALDLADVNYGPDTTVTFLGNAEGGTLTVTDGTETANISLVGNYLASTWDLSSDGSGGTVVVDPVSANNWQTLDIGAGGNISGIDAVGNAMVVRTDTYGAYIWSGTEWQQLVTASSMPAAFVAANYSTLDTGVYEIQIAPSNQNIFYMEYDGYIFKSTNEGASWTETNFSPVAMYANDSYRNDGQKMAIDPNNPNVVYAGTPQNGLFVTTNGGATWQSVSQVPVAHSDGNGGYPGITGILFDPAVGGVTNGMTNTIFAASYGNGVYESTNAGASWSLLAGSPTYVTEAAVSSTGVYYAVDGMSLLSYSNGVWTNLLNDPNDAGDIHAVAINPNNPNEIVVQYGSGALDVSYNAGATWSSNGSLFDQNYTITSTDIPWLTTTVSAGGFLGSGDIIFNPADPGELVATTGVGVFTTSTATLPTSESSPYVWTDQSLGIEQLVANQIIAPPGGDPVVATWDRGFYYISNPDAYASSYGPVSGGFTEGWALDYASSDPSFIVGVADWYGNQESGYSTNGGQTWNLFASDPPWASTAIGGMIAASSPTNIIWAGTGVDPYYTLNGGETWNPITLPGVTNWSGFDWAYYLDWHVITADRVLANTFYLFDPDVGVFQTTNGGQNWTEVYSGGLSTGDYYNPLLQSVPGEAGNLFFTGGPQSGGTPTDPVNEPFLRSTNGGATWTAVPNVSEVLCFGFGAAAPGQSYPAIYIVGWVNDVYGVWQSINNAQSWTQVGTFPNNSLDQIKTISGDPNIYGQVYVGFAGSGFAYLPGGPLVAAVAASPSTGTEVPGNTVTFTLTMTEAVTVTGTPTLTLNDGSTATYTGGSGTGALTFSYTVAADQNTPNLTVTAVNLNAATVADSGGNAANLSLTGLTQSGPQIETTAPTVTSVVASGIGISNGTGDLDAGKTVTLTLNMSGTVTVVGSTPTLTLNDGGTATYTGGSGTSALTFSYKVGAGQNTPELAVTAVNLHAATIADGAGNAANLSGGVTNPAGILQIDTTTPTVPSMVVSPSSGDLGVGRTVTLTAKMSEVVFVAGGTPTLTLDNNGTATYTGGSGTSALTFSYTVAAGQNTTDLVATQVNQNGATITNGAGNAANMSPLTYYTGPRIDTTTPSAPVIANDVVNVNNTVTLTGTAEANNAVTVSDGLTALGTTTANASGAWRYTTGALPNGAQNFTVKDTDAAGNVSTASAALTVTVDKVAPAAPTISSFSPDTGIVGDDITNATALTLTGTALANSTIEVFDGATELGTTTANASGAWSYTTGTLSNGAQNFTAKAVDLAGNVSAASRTLTVTVDAVPPTAPVIASDTINANNSVSLGGTSAANTTVTLYGGSTELGTTTANASGAWNYTTGPLTTGSQVFTATATDLAGNVSTGSSAVAVTVNAQTPAVPPAPVIANDTVNGNTVTLIGTAEADTTVTIYARRSVLTVPVKIGTTEATIGGTWSFASGALASGSYTFYATATSATGNTSAMSAGLDPIVGEPATPDANAASPTVTDTSEIAQASIATVAFQPGSMEKLMLDQPSTFAGTVLGLTGQNAIDPPGIAFDPQTTPRQAAGMVAFTDGSHSAKLTLNEAEAPNKTIELSDGSNELGATATKGSGARHYTTAPIGGGHHIFAAKEVDVDGNGGGASRTPSASIDDSALTNAEKQIADNSPAREHKGLIHSSVLDHIFKTPSSVNISGENDAGGLADHLDPSASFDTEMQHNSAATMSADIAGLQKEIQNVSLHTHSESGLDHSAAPLWTDIMTRPYNSGAHTAGPVAVLVGVAADSFMFPPELGTESVKNSADALFGPHSPDLDFGEHHADLHFASPELAQNVPSDATASGPPNAPSPHTHDFHLL